MLVVDENIARELGYLTGEAAEALVADAKRKVYLVRNALEISLLGEELSKVQAHLVIHLDLKNH